MFRTKRLPRIKETDLLRQQLDILEFTEVHIRLSSPLLQVYAQDELYPPVFGGHGRGHFKEYDPETIGEIAAFDQLRRLLFTKDVAREIRRLALELEDLRPTKENVRQIRERLQYQWKGKDHLAPAVVKWLCTKRTTLNFIYREAFATRKKELADILVRAKRRGESSARPSEETRAAIDELKEIEADEERDRYLAGPEFLKLLVMLNYSPPVERAGEKKIPSTKRTPDPFNILAQELAA